MIDDVLFYGIYLSQALVISLYAPSSIQRRLRGLIAAHPPAEFPKLYPVPVATIERVLRICFGLNLGILVLGLALLAAAWFSGYTFDRAWYGGDIPISDAHPRLWVGYTYLQLVPAVLFAYWGHRYGKGMRAAARSRIRTAELKPRRLLDFISPALLVTVAVTYVGAAVVLLLVVGESPRRIGGASVGEFNALLFAVLTLEHIGLAGVFFWALYGKKPDPYQTREDWARTMRFSLQCCAGVCALQSVLGAASSVLLAFDLLRYIPLLVSCFLQAVWVPLTLKLLRSFDQQSFDVYRADPHPAAALATNE